MVSVVERGNKEITLKVAPIVVEWEKQRWKYILSIKILYWTAISAASRRWTRETKEKPSEKQRSMNCRMTHGNRMSVESPSLSFERNVVSNFAIYFEIGEGNYILLIWFSTPRGGKRIEMLVVLIASDVGLFILQIHETWWTQISEFTSSRVAGKFN